MDNNRRRSTGSRNTNYSSVSRARLKRHSVLPVQNGGDSNGGLPIQNGETNGETRDEGIVVVGYEVMEERARFTVFKFRIRKEDTNESWIVCRRYTDFERLSTKLKEEFPHLSINLPPKRWLKNNFETSFLESRMKGLQAFVDIIIITHQLCNAPTVRAFFCLDEPPMYPENSEESRTVFGNFEETVGQLKDTLEVKEAEINFLKAELALLTVQNESLTKLSKVCRCGNRKSNPSSLTSKNSEPMLTSTPNLEDDLGKRQFGSEDCSIIPSSTPMRRRLKSDGRKNRVDQLQAEASLNGSTLIAPAEMPLHVDNVNCNGKSSNPVISHEPIKKTYQVRTSDLTNGSQNSPFEVISLSSSVFSVTPCETSRVDDFFEFF